MTLSVIPIVRWGKKITSKEAVDRAHTVVAQTVRENYSTSAMAHRWTKVLEEHTKTSPLDWSKPCMADAPPACRVHWYFHPHLRWLRKIAKLVRS